MFPSNPNPFGNQQGGSSAFSAFGNQAGGGAFTPFYQVKPNDKSLSDVAANTGQDLNNLVNLNGGAKTLPPVGSYIVTHPAGIPNNVVTTFTPQYGHTPQPGYPTAPYGPASQWQTPPMGQNYYGRGRSATTPEVQKMVTDLSQQLSQGTLPNTIPANVVGHLINPVTGTFFTPQDILASGFTADPITGNFVNKNAPKGGGAGNSDFANTASQQAYAAAGTDFYHQKRWDPKTRKFVEIGKLIRQGRLNERTGKFSPNFSPNKGYGMPHPVAAPMPNSTATASTVLGLHLGSG